ncbi:16S rRNA (cytidine(1402)-2'-O)-methyltransferase [Ligilactobacillus sp. WILCCON 0076]|uniref:Ribosomal RNA small subunit methyltransferase I n=1 Tax=Ligilactobacillus ubinensis TaxID=2876789 RepID=A0A9X2JLS6_9LACO|nr:16S rRNA (cytidine(1402)-2'-O)-methyltransferase [Ligilactobacillus ubinensis]MCP0886381.1 16S rRNA (cytidine(1402)-2'-O)-methyltransferase [Ligilactobacillus ubinensis]
MSYTQVSSFQNDSNLGHLYLVPTPIGNLGDMTTRAIEILQSVELIAAEDTRNTAKLLNYFEIKTPQISFHEHNTQERIPRLLEYLQNGKDIAQVSDAGMPSISDPGHELVVACVKKQIPVIPLPGANAALTALIASGLVPQPFLFYGFLPRKIKDQKDELQQLNKQTVTLIFYESPHRLKKTLVAMKNVFGEEREVVLCRELTKRYEEFIRGNMAELCLWSETAEIRGEFVVLVSGNSNCKDDTSEKDELAKLSLKAQVEYLIEHEAMKPNIAIKEIAKRNALKKQEVYNKYHQID